MKQENVHHYQRFLDRNWRKHLGILILQYEISEESSLSKLFKIMSEFTFPSLQSRDLYLDTLWHALRFNPKIEPESRPGWSGYMLMMSSRDYPVKSMVHMLHITDLIQTTFPVFTQLYLLLFNSLKNQPLCFKGFVRYIFASFLYMSKREHLWNKEKCVLFTSKAHFVLKIIKF